ncbi:MAG: hypothetical protein GC168_15085 [Candidatus Hydrogenedens sp.]|nr:hypothetical protein [Candidatus Hydrogenedens sp.]
MIRFFLGIACLISMAASAAPFAGAPYTDGDTYADTWVATDALGRTVPGAAETGPPRKDKWVGIFYWTWHTQRGGPNDNTKILADVGEDGVVAWPENHAPYHWGEPELGYYLMTDPFVIRKHASMLVDAGIDVVLFDTTNPPHTWKAEYEALCTEYTAMRAEGARTPSIGFICPFWDPTPVSDILWEDLYEPGLWSDLWFRWKGKPLLLANKDFIKDEAMLSFFTFRRPMPDYWLGPSGPEQWSWLEVYPQHVFRDADGNPEQMSVGVAQNALPDTPGPAPMSHRAGAMGRSWHEGAKDTRENAADLGLNFEEQWKRAMEVDPKFIFVTGWNEWIAGRYTEWSKYTDADAYYPGGLFVDQYTHEYSRDCEPMRGGHTDNYYYQLASWVRRYKGAREIPVASSPANFDYDSPAAWSKVQPEYRDTIGDTTHRNHPGYGDLVYTNTTGRNDFVILKAAHDAERLYFYAQTKDELTPDSDPNWMLLLLDTDQNAATGWLGYDYVLNIQPEDEEGRTSLHAWKENKWEAAGYADYSASGNALMLSLARELLPEMGTAPSFDFHWADNIQSFGDVSELGVNGDSAPNRRWNYRYQGAH